MHFIRYYGLYSSRTKAKASRSLCCESFSRHMCLPCEYSNGSSLTLKVDPFLGGRSSRQVAFYIRVSTERQTRVEEGSLKNLKQMLQAELERRNAQQKDWGSFIKAYVDEGISGKTTNWPTFQQMLVDIRWSPMKILNSYHLRWPVETGIKDLVENYFLNKPTGISAEKSECHYYCVMASRLAIDLFLENLAKSRGKSPEGWRCVLSTVRSTLFSDQNCELSLDDSGGLLVTYLDSDANGIKRRLKSMFERLNELDHWRVPWWNNRAIRINVEDQSALFSGSEIRN